MKPAMALVTLFFIVQTQGAQPLMSAAREGNLEQVRIELASGVGVDSRNRMGQTALMTAAEHCHPAIVAFLLHHGANPNATDAKGNTALMLAADASCLEAVEALLGACAAVNAANGNNVTALMFASGHPKVIIVKRLLKAGAAVNARSTAGRTALHSAAGSQHAQAIAAITASPPYPVYWDSTLQQFLQGEGNVENVNILLAHGAQAAIEDTNGQSPLSLALCFGHTRVESALRKAGADDGSLDRWREVREVLHQMLNQASLQERQESSFFGQISEE